MKIIPSEAIYEINRRALNSPNGIKITFNSEGEAINFHQRYNTVRQSVVSKDPDTEWRTLQMRREGLVLYLEPVDNHIMRLKIEEL